MGLLPAGTRVRIREDAPVRGYSRFTRAKLRGRAGVVTAATPEIGFDVDVLLDGDAARRSLCVSDLMVLAADVDVDGFDL